MSFRFLHLADVHLETHFGGRPQAKERLREATREAFRRAIDLALEEELHAVLVAGDLFDEGLLCLRTELFLTREVRRLSAAGIHFLYACGNHDPGGAGCRAPRLEFLDTSGEGTGRVHIFASQHPERIDLSDKSGNPVAIVVGAGHADDRVQQNLAACFPVISSELPVVGLLHTQVESALSSDQHARYAPSERSDYELRPYAYWALGHVHLRQEALPASGAWYSGNIQGRNARESGAKGGLLVEAEAGGVATPRFVPFAPLRWERLAFADWTNIGGTEDLLDALVQRIEEERARYEEDVLMRIDLHGETQHAALLRDPRNLRDLEEELLERTGATEIELRARDLRQPRDWQALRAAPTLLGRALVLAEEAGTSDTLLQTIAPAQLAGLEWTGSAQRETARKTYLRRLLAGIEEDLALRLIEEEDA